MEVGARDGARKMSERQLPAEDPVVAAPRHRERRHRTVRAALDLVRHAALARRRLSGAARPGSAHRAAGNRRHLAVLDDADRVHEDAVPLAGSCGRRVRRRRELGGQAVADRVGRAR